MRLIGDVILDMRRDIEADPARMAAVETTRELLRLWMDDAAMLDDIRTYSTGKSRCDLCIMLTRGSEESLALARMQDLLISHESNHGYVHNRHGYWSPGDLRSAGARTIRDERGIRDDFPISWPWHVKPQPDMGIPGERANPTHRERVNVPGWNVPAPDTGPRGNIRDFPGTRHEQRGMDE